MGDADTNVRDPEACDDTGKCSVSSGGASALINGDLAENERRCDLVDGSEHVEENGHCGEKGFSLQPVCEGVALDTRNANGYQDGLFASSEVMDYCAPLNGIHGNGNVIDSANRQDNEVVRCETPPSLGPEKEEAQLAIAEIPQAIHLEYIRDREAPNDVIQQHGPALVAKEAVHSSLEYFSTGACNSPVQVLDDNLNNGAPCPSSSPGSHRNVTDTSVTISDGSLKVGNNGHTHIVFVRRSNPKRASTTRTTTDHNMSFQPAGTKICVGKVSSKRVTRKRSCSNKPARCSPWGAFCFLLGILKKYPEHLQRESGAFHEQRDKLKKDMPLSAKQVLKSCVSISVDHTTPASAQPSENIPLLSDVSFDVVVPSWTYYDNLQNADCQASIDPSIGDECCINPKSLRHIGRNGDKDLGSFITQDTSLETIQSDSSAASSRVGLEALEDGLNLPDPGTSPDSVVLHPVMDASVINGEDATSEGLIYENGSCDSLITSSEGRSLVSASLPDIQKSIKPKQSMKGENNWMSCGGHCSPSNSLPIEENLQCPKISKKERKARKHGKSGWKKLDCSAIWHYASSKSIRRKSKHGSGLKKNILEQHISGVSVNSEEIGMEKKATRRGDCNGDSRARLVDSIAMGVDNSYQIHGDSKIALVKALSRRHDLSESKKRVSGGKRKKGLKVKSESKSMLDSPKQHPYNEDIGDSKAFHGMQMKLAMNETEKLNRKGSPRRITADDISNSASDPLAGKLPLEEIQKDIAGKPLPNRIAWALCDDCQKWRCIPAELADAIDETNRTWTCKDNNDKAFADCSIPQEKTNAEINAELQISDEEDCLSRHTAFKATEGSTFAASPSASWKPIRSNIFLHRNRKTQTIDEVMVCHCKLPSDGSFGCSEECLNRMLNIECNQATCPCGDLCSNRQFQKRKYAKCRSFPCGKKGHGLQLLQNVSKGQFLIEYVGEVLDIAAYESRQKYYASRGQRHFYFMTLNGGEVIDAYVKGNLGRFINHSCDPNCRTEKWMIKGEVCIGLFAIRDIKKGEELTFDYNYVRVFGAAAKKCVCGSSECRGIIGADPSNNELIVQGDSEDDYCEPVMVEDSNGTIFDFAGVKAMTHEEILSHSLDVTNKCDSTISKAEACLPSDENRGLSHIISSDTSKTPCTARIEYGHPSEIQLFDSSMLASDIVKIEEIEETKTKATSNLICEKPKISGACLVDKSSLPHVRMKKGKSYTEAHKEVKRVQNTVEGKLNFLLDENGGISKRRDATKGYLQLLVLTAAEGDNVKDCVSQSMRDLSLTLDALLKTKSRLVLTDVINKNGLQMLHNIMKQNRKKFNRIPIIRKLLKVLEFLASKGILTTEQMSKGPPCSGMESFRDSISDLTKHNDTQVQQIARNFLNKYIPRSIRRGLSSQDGVVDSEYGSDNRLRPSTFGCHDGYGWMESRSRTPNAVSTPMEISVASKCCDAPSSSMPSAETVTRKRKSRWDQPMDSSESNKLVMQFSEGPLLESHPNLTSCSAEMQSSASAEVSGQKSETHGNSLGPMDIGSEAPPGFGSPCKDHSPPRPSEAREALDEVVVGVQQDTYLSHMPVSYGIPVELMLQVGIPANIRNPQCLFRWAVAPGMTFHPFPPLPTYPRKNAMPVDCAMQTLRNNGAGEPRNHWQHHPTTGWHPGAQGFNRPFGQGNHNFRARPPAPPLEGPAHAFGGISTNHQGAHLPVGNHVGVSGGVAACPTMGGHQYGNPNFHQ